MQKKEEWVRIHKLLSDVGVMSRRKAEEFVQNGKVTVNGRKALVGQKVNHYGGGGAGGYPPAP